MLAVGHQHDHQRGAGALRRVHEQFHSLVPWTPTGLRAEDSDDVKAGKEKHIGDGIMDILSVRGRVCMRVQVRVRVTVCIQYIHY